MAELPEQPGGAEQDYPSPYAEPERYQGRPLLVLLENYILDAIGELPSDRQQEIRAVVRRAFGGGNDWKATLRRQLGLDDSLDLQLAELWPQHRAEAKTQGIDLHPVQFAKLITDQEFADLIGPPTTTDHSTETPE